MAVIFQDNFNRADTTDLGPDWQEVGSDFGIASNELRPGPYTNPVQCVYTTALSSSDYAVQAKIIFRLETKKTPGIFARGVWNATTLRYDCYYAYIYPRNQKITLELFQNGSYTSISSVVDSTIDSTGATPYTLRLEVEGSTLRVYLDGVLKITATDTTLTSGGYAGVMAGAAAYAIGWDDFVIESLGGTVYTENIGFDIALDAANADLQFYLDYPTFAITSDATPTTIQHYITSMSFDITDDVTPTDAQHYIDSTAFDITDEVTAADLATYLERLSTDITDSAQALDLQRYLEQLVTAIVSDITSTAQKAGFYSDSISFVISGDVVESDKQFYKQQISFDITAVISSTSVATFVEKLNTALSTDISATSVANFIESIVFAASGLINTSDLAHYLDVLGIEGLVTVVTQQLSYQEDLTMSIAGAITVGSMQHFLPQSTTVGIRTVITTNDVAVLGTLPGSYLTVTAGKDVTVKYGPTGSTIVYNNWRI